MSSVASGRYNNWHGNGRQHRDGVARPHEHAMANSLLFVYIVRKHQHGPSATLMRQVVVHAAHQGMRKGP